MMKKIARCAPGLERRQVEVYGGSGGQPWLAVVLQGGPEQSLIRWVRADPDLVGRETYVANRHLRLARVRRE
jgi:hypothetical protein